MKQNTTLIPVIFLLVIVFFSPFVTPMMGDWHTNSSPTFDLSTADPPPVPQGTPEWIDVSLATEYFYNDTATISWSGRASSGIYSPFNPLYNWTSEGIIEGGIWPGNPGNATITVTPKANYSEPSIIEFLNYTMDHYVQFTSWPSLAIFNFTEYVNGSLWIFEDAMASIEEFFNTTFYHVSNASKYLMNGFNATGIAPIVTEFRIHLQWNLTDSVVQFSYRIPDATILQGDTFIFSLGRAMGRTTPLTLAGTGNFKVTAPFDRLIVNATPTEAYENVTFPYLPIGVEDFTFDDESEKAYDFKIWFIQPASAMSLSREVTTTSLNRGQLMTVKVIVINTGDLALSNVIVRDLESIQSGVFQLVAGLASTITPLLAPGDNITMEYTLMALQSGSYLMPSARAIGVDQLQNQIINATTTDTITIGAGMLPSETNALLIGIGIVVLIVVAFILYRLRHRFI